MIRYAIVGIIVAVAIVLYAFIDAAMIDRRRMRGLSKPAWLAVIVLLPVIGALLWFLLGRGKASQAKPVSAPDDDPRFTATKLSSEELDEHVRELEERLRMLEEETFPGENPEDEHTGDTK